MGAAASGCAACEKDLCGLHAKGKDDEAVPAVSSYCVFPEQVPAGSVVACRFPELQTRHNVIRKADDCDAVGAVTNKSHSHHHGSHANNSLDVIWPAHVQVPPEDALEAKKEDAEGQLGAPNSAEVSECLCCGGTGCGLCKSQVASSPFREDGMLAPNKITVSASFSPSPVSPSSPVRSVLVSGRHFDAVPIDLGDLVGGTSLRGKRKKTVSIAKQSSLRSRSSSNHGSNSGNREEVSQLVKNVSATIAASGAMVYQEGEDELSKCRRRAECLKAALAFLLVFGALGYGCFFLSWNGRENPTSACALEQKASRGGVCKPCGDEGLWLLPLGQEWEREWSEGLQTGVYLTLMLWCFLGVQIVCDLFMASIEQITGGTKERWVQKDGAWRKLSFHVWNDTVANLTLMALGSSAPEIMLSVIELVAADFGAGKLGPSTVVGSAAFNLFVITGVCISAIPVDEVRRVDQIEVFLLTSLVSVMAYLWIWVVLEGITPDKVDLWEGIATLAMFPIMVWASFVVDKGYCRCFCSLQRSGDVQQSDTPATASKEISKATDSLRRPSTTSLASNGPERASSRGAGSSLFLRQSSTLSSKGGMAAIKRSATKSRIRQELSAKMSASRKQTWCSECMVSFPAANHTVPDVADVAVVRVTVNRPVPHPVQLRYSTKDGSTKAGLGFAQTDGVLHFETSDMYQTVEVPLIRRSGSKGLCSYTSQTSAASKTLGKGRLNDLPDFHIELFDLKLGTRESRESSKSHCSDASARPTTSSELKDGRLAPASSMDRSLSDLDGRGNKMPFIGISTTAVWIVDDNDSGSLGFEVQEVFVASGVETATLYVVRQHGSSGHVSVSYLTRDESATDGQDYMAREGILEFDEGQLRKSIAIDVSGSRPQGDRRFTVHLYDGGAGSSLANEESLHKCAVVLRGETEGAPEGLLRQWCTRMSEAFLCNGSVSAQAEASCLDWIFHCLALFWKVLFLLVPPAEACGGWLCFVLALVMVGGLTFLVKELAQLLGCAFGLDDEITAVTLVALGTSLPDTFASRTAAVQDECADSAIGNVNGSNAVNVFLGLGLTWTIGSVYWHLEGASDRWRSQRHLGQTFESLWIKTYPEGGFMSPSGSLAFSVTVFSGAAVLCYALLLFRRRVYGGELGGPKFAQRRDMVLLLFVWAGFLAAYIWRVESSRRTE